MMMYRFTGMPGPFCETEDTKAYKQTETIHCVQRVRQEAKPPKNATHRYENERVLDCGSIPVVTAKQLLISIGSLEGKTLICQADSH
jgi:hypothetical protein